MLRPQGPPSQRLRWCALFALSELAATGLCARTAYSSEEDGDGTEVLMLVTRHGLSCANVANYWGYSLLDRQQHVLMLDPALTAVGVYDARAQGEGVRKWLSSKGYQGVDIRVSSVLQRAVETSFYQYPKTLHGIREQVHIAPYIRETTPGPWRDNEARPIEKQQAELPSGFDAYDLETASAQAAPGGMYASGSWDDFLGWVGSTLLPSSYAPLLSKQGGGAGPNKTQPIIIAVATHSHFMAKDKGIGCKGIWEEKPANSQAVALTYIMQSGKLQRQGECEPVVPGVRYNTKEPICKRDLGDRCHFTVEPPTVEAMLKEYIKALNQDKAQKLVNSQCQDRQPFAE